ncbi:MAG: hypothetical protein KBC33_00300 [Candidatus Pacebacteria bacterium]|nr:hypothetical protein [Candidatus Paceibacterota bacterium]
MEISTTEFSVARAMELYDLLKEKQNEYLIRIKGLEFSWDNSWYEMDLLARYDEDPDFKLLYYKFVIVSVLVMACEKYPQKVREKDPHVEDVVSARYVGVDLSHALCRSLNVKVFNNACDVISDYLSGKLVLQSSGPIPTEPQNLATI